MGYTTEEGRTQILDDAGAAVDQLSIAIAALGEAYEHLDDDAGERMETELFRPLQGAYGQLKRTHSDFAQRSGLPGRNFPAAPAPPPEDPRVSLEHAADAIQAADEMLAELQDTLLPVEVGDQELRGGLSGARTVIAPLPERCDEFVRTLGR
ncbi:MAG TPA: hypothetical protein VHU61_11090 [Solirubrobacteraceae bacterium]|jgi:hypothetical protein|nr:hypothetical protein [Solirubrobacteraceae bacterium]